MMRNNKRALVTILCLIFIFAIGLFLRIPELSHPGGYGDVWIVQNWGRTVVERGWVHGYGLQKNGVMKPNYPPVGLAIFGATVRIYDLIQGTSTDNSFFLRKVMKVPGVLADLLLALFFFAFLRKFVSVKAGLMAAGIYLIFPLTWVISARWGQTDAMNALLAFSWVTALVSGAPGLGGICVALALLTKPLGIVLLPISVVILVHQRRDIIIFLFGFLTMLLVVIVPFFMADTLKDVVKVYVSNMEYFPVLSFNTYNFWWAIYKDAAHRISDRQIVFGIISFRQIGIGLFSLCYGLFTWRLSRVLRKHSDPGLRAEAILAASSMCALAFFLFVTQMHERYGFLFFTFALPLSFFMKRGQWYIGGLLFVWLFNVLHAFPFSPLEYFFFRTFPAFDRFLSVAAVVLFVLLARIVWRTSLNPDDRVSLTHSE